MTLVKSTVEKKVNLDFNKEFISTFSEKIEAGNIQFINQTLPFTIRDYFMSDCRFGLSLSYGETDDFVNPFRIMSMVANGMPVLADHQIDEDNYLDLCESFEFDELLNVIPERGSCSTGLLEKCRSIDLADNLRGIL